MLLLLLPLVVPFDAGEPVGSNGGGVKLRRDEGGVKLGGGGGAMGVGVLLRGGGSEEGLTICLASKVPISV